LIEYCQKSKKWKRIQKSISSSVKVADIAIRKSHLKDWELSAKALALPIEQRVFKSFTFPMDEHVLKEVDLAIENFVQTLSKISDRKKAQEVYRVTIGCFPLTKLIRRD
jgi:uncharacterized protein (TIGR02147 family)